jgi:hypothetical protein
MGLHIILVGNPIDGYRVIGPFKTVHHAIDYANDWLADEAWHVAPLNAPEN